MIRVCVEHLEPGLTLAKDVEGLDGSVLLAKGELLTPERIEFLVELGAAHVFVAPDDDKREDRRRMLSRVEEYSRDFFAFVDPDMELFQALFRLSVARTAKAAAKGFKLLCRAELRAENVEHLEDLLTPDKNDPAEVVKKETTLASFPDIYFRIKEVLDNPKSSADDIARVVSNDVGLSAKLLKLVNSPFFGFSTTIDSVARAVSLVGTRELSTLALGISTINCFKDIPSELVDMKSFWRHSLRCGIIAKLLAGRAKLSSERFFTAGLLHDAGKLVIYKHMPYAATEALIFARANMLPVPEAEAEVLGYDHAWVGRLLLAEWQFPEGLVDAIAHHHDPQRAANPRDAALLGLADNMANAAEIAAGGTYVLPGLAPEHWELTGLDVEDVEQVMARHEESLEEITKAFF